MNDGQLVFWDVDTQIDFINPNGKLPIPKAETIVSNLQKLTQYAKKNNNLCLGSVDRHFRNDIELKSYPPHCMDGTKGQRKIPETLFGSNLTTYIRSKVGSFGRYDSYTSDEIQIEIRNYNQIIFEKQHTDVFTNRNVLPFLNHLRVSSAIVYGVATDICVNDAVIGLRKLGIDVYVVEDAIMHLDYDTMLRVVDNWIDNLSIRFVKTNEIVKDNLSISEVIK